MDSQRLLSALHQLTGTLKPGKDTTDDDLKTLHRILAEQLLQHPEMAISGNSFQHAVAEGTVPVPNLPERFSHISDLLKKKPPAVGGTAPLIFKRETAFRNTFLGNSVPQWGTGLAVTHSYGPFTDDLGLDIWFDFFQPVKMVSVYIQGNAAPTLLIPVWGTLTGKKSYRIEAGSVWIASHFIAKTSLLQGYYTGLKVRGGTLDLSVNATISGGNIIIHPTNTASLQLDLNQNTVTNPSADAGLDATNATVHLPETFSLQFNAFHSAVTAPDASCTVFDTETRFQFKNLPPVWIGFLSQILIPYTVTTRSDTPDIFPIHSSNSKLCKLKNNAKLDTNSGWLLPAAKLNPSQLGAASGTGALCIGLQKGIHTNWKGLKGGDTRLNHPAIIVEPGMVTVIDFFAENMYGKQKWILWENAHSKHHSEINLGFGKIFPFLFISSSKGSESVWYFCNHKASFDRPVDANGTPFKIESIVALAGITQTGTAFRASLFDNDLLFDGNFNKPDAYIRHSLALRNAFFSITAPYSLVLSGELLNDNHITKGVVALTYGIYIYLPTLPDPYVASYTSLLRGREAMSSGSSGMALAGFVKWPDPAGVAEPQDSADNPAYVYFRFVPFDQSAFTTRTSSVNTGTGNVQTGNRNFQTGVRTFNQPLNTAMMLDKANLPLVPMEETLHAKALQPVQDISIREKIRRSVQSDDLNTAIHNLESNQLLSHIKDKKQQVNTVLDTALRNTERSVIGGLFDRSVVSGASMDAGSFMAVSTGSNLLYARDLFMLLDVSSNADQMGVSFGTGFRVERGEHGETNLLAIDTVSSRAVSTAANMPLQILNMDVVSIGQYVRAVTLPQISWEPISNIPLAIEGPPDPQDLITVTPGILVYDNDGIPTHIFSESPYQVPITPLSVTHHFIKEYNDKQIPRQLHSTFTLPFAMIAQADFNRNINQPENKNAKLHLHMPWFNQLRGGLQIKAEAPVPTSFFEKNSFKGWTLQLDNNIKWFILGLSISGSTLGKQVKDIFNKVFTADKPKVPLEKIEFSGYGASIFSNWLNDGAAIADVSQAKFDVLVGRTAHEVVQVRSVMYMCTGIVHVVRTITLMRSPNGYVFRSDSGWKAESDAFYNCDYNIDFGEPNLKEIKNPYEFHAGVIKGVSNVREIKDYPAGGVFSSSFSLNESGLPSITGKNFTDWKDHVFKSLTSLDEQLPVVLQAVLFDGDVHMDNITSGGVKSSTDFKVQSRKMLGYVQLSPTGILITPKVFAGLLNFQNGSLGGPVDCTMDIAGSKQKMRFSRVDINPALDPSGKNIFVSAARGSLILPPDGSWSVVKQHTDSGDVKPVEEGQSVPLIKANGNTNVKIANPADVVQAASKINFGVLQSTGTQKLLFDIPQFSNGVPKLLSNETYFADAYKLLNAKSIFPNIANALKLTNAEKELQILGEGLMKMADRNLNLGTLLPNNYQYPFIDEPGILKVYAEYSSNEGNGNLKLGIDSVAAIADKWKAALSNIRVVVDLGPFQRLMWVDGNFNASSGINPKYDKPNLQFGPILEPVVDILRVLAMLSGEGFDEGMKVGMSNAPLSWEYKFNCSKEIPVIKFPSPTQLTINPNPPLKLEAGLKVGFYFNEVLSIPGDLKQLVPACGAYVQFYGRLQVQCFTLAVASVYAVGQVVLGIQADSKAGLYLYMKVGFGVEIVVGLPVVANVAVLYMVEVEVGLGTTSLDVGALMLFRGSAEICGGLIAICIQIEAGGGIHRDLTTDRTNCVAQVTFSIDVCVLWVIDINFTDSWEESRQIA
ncbi:MAG: hypothetical protein DCC43_08185 [Candidatus Brocadia sp.]|nr:hypothetical protein [Candidatus Brocadia sp.]MCE7911344.1 hypothetical protein [Candidatus Brocadia sp. AMX3]MDG5995915.1 hypothetical protein [Candidatus Brocadia sp.]RIJ99555.1 MAG: hypothetical protein DCC43_08185 [Candidatus Brocadia sp.]